jgi:tetratricopeptide (TPR) repeat protein
VFALSDLHWAADPVLEFVDRLLARLKGRPVVVVGTARPGFELRWAPAPGHHNLLVVHLDPLDRDATRDLIDALFCGDVDDDVVAFLTERSGGNPFFVEELAALVRDSAPNDGARPDLDNDALRSLPATLHGLVAARLDALDADERSVLEDCAIVGGSGTLASVYALAARTDAEALLARLEERDLVVLDNDEFRFKSEVIREVAYGRLTKAERARRHATLAPVLAVDGEAAIDQVAHHFAVAAELVQELGSVPDVPDDIVARAITALEAAADHAEAVESWIASGNAYERLLGLISDEPEPRRWHALIGRARSCTHRRELDRARDDGMVVLEEAREFGDEEYEAAALLLLGEVFFNAGEYDAAEQAYAQAAQKWRGLGRQSGVANALRGLGFTLMFRGETDEAERLIREALASFRQTEDRRGEAWALQNLAWISFSRGHTQDAEERLHESADQFAELGDWGGLGWALGLLAYVRYIQGSSPTSRCGAGAARNASRAVVRRSPCSATSATGGARCRRRRRPRAGWRRSAGSRSTSRCSPTSTRPSRSSPIPASAGSARRSRPRSRRRWATSIARCRTPSNSAWTRCTGSTWATATAPSPTAAR